jgi:hypothetical protein
MMGATKNHEKARYKEANQASQERFQEVGQGRISQQGRTKASPQ